MRILSHDTDTALKNISILLTQSEASELRDDLNRLLDNKSNADHSHMADTEYEHEITIALYEPNSIDPFNQRMKELIMSDK